MILFMVITSGRELLLFLNYYIKEKLLIMSQVNQSAVITLC